LTEIVEDVGLPCSIGERLACGDCSLDGKLMCRFEVRDALSFALGFVPYGAIAVMGVVLGGYGIFLIGWLAYALFFFLIWEARVLCRHCPYWASEGRTLRCHANYGVFKLWDFDPNPMSRSEGIQFLLGAIVFVGYPIPFMIIGGQYALALIAILIGIAGLVVLYRRTCSRCVNFSCPLNHVPQNLVDAYVEKNPAMKIGDS
jgi:hypothetical protein